MSTIPAFTATVDKQAIILEQLHDLVASSKDVYTGQFVLDDEWDGFIVTALFKNEYGSQTVLLDDTNTVAIIPDILRGTRLYVGLRGTKDNQVLTTSAPAILTIKSSYTQFVEWDDIYTANQYDELMNYFADTRDTVENVANQVVIDKEQAQEAAEQSTQSAQQAAENAIQATNKAKEAQQFAAGAEQSKTQASQSATAAATSATQAANSVTTAAQKVTEATNAANTAKQHAMEATNKATEAAASAAEAIEQATIATEQAAIATEQATELANSVEQVTANKNAITALHNNKADAIVEKETGNIITSNDASNLGLQSLTLYGKSTQDGTPTPENPIEIVSVENSMVGVGDKNLISFPFFHENGHVSYGVTFIYDSKGVFTISGILEKITAIFLINNDFDCNIGETYYLNNNNNNNKYYIFVAIYERITGVYQKTLATYNNSMFIIPNNFDKTTQRIRLYVQVSGEIGDEINISGYYPFLSKVEPQTITFPYTLHGIPVDSGGNYTDADGQQWVCDTIEVNADGTGKLVKRCVEITIDDTFDMRTYGSDTLQRGFYIKNVLSEDMYWGNGFANIFIVKMSGGYESNTIWLGSNNKIVYVINSSFYDESLTDKGIANFKAYLAENPLKIVTYVTTPTETDLTEAEVLAFKALHTNKPYTTIFNDQNGDMTVEYVADTKLYIDNKFEELQNAILSTGGNV